METTNEIRARNAIERLLDIVEHQYVTLAKLPDALLGGFLSANIARDVIATRCADTAKLMEEKL